MKTAAEDKVPKLFIKQNYTPEVSYEKTICVGGMPARNYRHGGNGGLLGGCKKPC
jgi:hypothetical protein